MQIKMTMRYHFTFIKMAPTKKTSTDEDVEMLKPLRHG